MGDSNFNKKKYNRKKLKQQDYEKSTCKEKKEFR